MTARVALIGRPNVGKSTLFNRMARGQERGRISAITEETPGVTRDRNYRTARWSDTVFEVIDTGGIAPSAATPEEDDLSSMIRMQAMRAVEEANVVIHVCDGTAGVMPADREIAEILRKSGKKTLLVVNKIDSPEKMDRIYEFYSLGTEGIIPVSALSGHGYKVLMETLVAELSAGPAVRLPLDSDEFPKIAVVGRPNVGKSTLINALLSTERLIVTPIPGTTRDAIDTVCRYHGRGYLFIDTAGIRRRVPRATIEEYSVTRSMKSIERADVVIVVLDASQGVLDQDQKIAGIASESGKGVMIIANKWDLISDPEESFGRLTLEIRRKMWSVDYAPILTVSGLQKKRVTKVFPLIDEIISQRRKRISTADLNRTLADLTSLSPLPDSRGRKVKAYYMTQTGIEPPSFVVFVNIASAFSTGVRKGFERGLRVRHGFAGTPLRISFRSR